MTDFSNVQITAKLKVSQKIRKHDTTKGHNKLIVTDPKEMKIHELPDNFK